MKYFAHSVILIGIDHGGDGTDRTDSMRWKNDWTGCYFHPESILDENSYSPS